MTRPNRAVLGTALRTAPALGLAAVLLAGCGGAEDSGATAATGGAGTRYASATTTGVQLVQGWATTSTMSGMSDMSGMDSGSGKGDMSDMTGAGSTGAAYATLADTGSRPDALVSVSTPAAAEATLHNTVTSSNGSSGRMVAVRQVPVPAGGTVTLQPGGYHVMLTGLGPNVKVGSTIPMTWHFRSGATVTTAFPVIDVADRPQATP